MKKQTNSLTIIINNKKREPDNKEILSLLIPGSLMIIGLLCTLSQEWNLGNQGILMIVPAVAAMFFSTFLKWEERWQAFTAIGMFVILLLLGIIFKQTFGESLAEVLEIFSQWKLLRTGIYQVPYETAGNTALILMLAACLTGFIIGQIVRGGNIIWLLILVFPVLFGWMCGWLESGWSVAVYMTGVLLLFVKYASGYGKVIYYSKVIVFLLALIAAGGTWICEVQTNETGLGRKIVQAAHALRWEEEENPLPEGNIRDFGAYRPKNEAVLEITMKTWTPLYLRGYVAGEYTKNGWEPIAAERLTEDAEELYTIQKNYFFASDQIAKAWESIEQDADNSVNIQVLDACRATTYLPYAAGNLPKDVLNPLDLRKEGTSAPKTLSYQVDLYSLEDSYLLQGELSNQQTSEYRSAESAYRDFVYDQYLAIPEDVYNILTKYISADKGITTVQAKQSITKLLGEMLTYNENIITDIGKKNFPEYVIEVSGQGYSVHYATLATLLMRCCGIPARYVEGYVITPKQAEMMPDGEQLTLTQYDSHAWTEYYLDGVGWLPFDATPGYEDILKYELPEEGVPAGHAGLEKNLNAWKELKNKLNKKPLIKEDETERNQNNYIEEVIGIFALMILLVLIAMIARTIYLRYVLRKKLERFQDQDYRFACACILSYMQDLSNTLEKGKQAAGMNVREKADRMASMLGENFIVSEVETMLNEVWFSDHEITELHQKRALVWLNKAKETWIEETSIFQKMKHRWITCKIL